MCLAMAATVKCFSDPFNPNTLKVLLVSEICSDVKVQLLNAQASGMVVTAPISPFKAYLLKVD